MNCKKLYQKQEEHLLKNNVVGHFSLFAEGSFDAGIEKKSGTMEKKASRMVNSKLNN